MAGRKTKSAHTPVESIKHRDRRPNIPTEELRDFVADDEETPPKVLYPRDPSLDPQLVWKGKEEQDAEDLAVPVVPIYIQEKIHPQALVENLRDTARRGEPEPEVTLFDDFNGLGFEDMIEFYRHDQNWTNRMILGDSLMVMTSLAEKEGLKGKVQMIYIDPPYGIKFGSNWQVSTRKRDVKDGSEADLTRQPEQIRAFRDTWQLGIHSYLPYLRDRFAVARELLTETGSIFVQIGDENVHLVRCVMDEVFGSGQFIAVVVVQKTGGLTQNLLPGTTDFLLWYARCADTVKYRALFLQKGFGEGTQYQLIQTATGECRRATAEERAEPSLLPAGARYLQYTSVESENPRSAFEFQGQVYHHRWKTSPDGRRRLARASRLYSTGLTLRYCRYHDDYPVAFLSNNWTDTGSGSFLDPQIYVVQTVTKAVQRCLLMTTDPGDLVLDPTCVREGTLVLTPPVSPPQAGGKEAGRRTTAPSPLAGRAGEGSPSDLARVPIEHLRPGDLVIAHDAQPHAVLRVIRRRHEGRMIGVRRQGMSEPLWLTEDHLVLANRRVRALSAEGEWSSVPPAHFGRARELRREMSPPERTLWAHLRRPSSGVRFRRQHPIGPYIADFYSREAGLVVEVDGESHYEGADSAARDARRDDYMETLGLRVLRVSATDVCSDPAAVAEAVGEAAREVVLLGDPAKQWRFAGNLRVGDTVYHGPGLAPARIVSTETQETIEYVYDLEVEGAHSFLTDVCAVHNCGSGTTAFVAEQWGRRWITVDTSRVALALARTRLMTAKYPYYLLADTQEGFEKLREVDGGPLGTPPDQYHGDIRRGFAYRRVPHITLKSIANNEEIDEIHERWQVELEPLRAQLNEAAGQSWEEWEMPRADAADGLPAKARELLDRWWELRRKRQREIDDSISRHADFELLYDQPYEDSKRVRVSGPFTVESLSPHRVLETDDVPAAVAEGKRDDPDGQFETLILENLRKAGVENRVKAERLKFDSLEAHPGAYIHATGEYTDAEGATRRAALTIGPEHGTVGPQLVKEAAKEAVRGIGFDVLVVCGFAFDPHVTEEAKRYGNLTVLPAKINPDLAMGGLLKPTGTGNLFMVFGEPDLSVAETPEGKLTVEIRGVDVYDPTTGEIRSNSTDDIACWFIDTNYNGESFFVRHAYFTGADEPYDKLKCALRADISEEAWSTLYSTVSRAFAKPQTGKIAVKVINHYGDEVLKVYHVGGRA